MTNVITNHAISYWSLGIGGSYNTSGTFYAGYADNNNYQVGSIRFTNNTYAKTIYVTLKIYDKLKYTSSTPLYVTWNDLSADINYINRYDNENSDIKAQFSFSSSSKEITFELNDIPSGTHYIYIWGDKDNSNSRLRFSFPEITYDEYINIPSKPEIISEINYVKLNENYLLQWNASIGQDGATIDKYIIEFSTDDFTTINKTLIIDGDLLKVSFLLDNNFISGLIEDTKIDWRIYVKDSHGLFSEKTTSSFKINNSPNPPILSKNSIILPSGGGSKKITITAGADKDGQTCQIGYNTNENLPIIFYDSPYELSLNKAGTYYFWTYDGIETSTTATTCEVKLNTKPVIESSEYTVNNSDSHKLTGTITASLQDGKIATNANVYIKNAMTSFGIKDAIAELLEDGFTTTYNTNNITINIDLNGKNIEDYSYYMVGFEVKDEYEYSDIVWSNVIVQVIGDFPLTINEPVISNTDNVSEKYSSYYRNEYIVVNWTPPNFSGDIDLYYNLLYSTDSGGQWKNCLWQYNEEWQNDGAIYSGRVKLNNSDNISVIAKTEANGNKLLIKVELYNKLESETKKLSSNSNSLTYVPMISWPASSPFELAIVNELNDGRNVVRPTYHKDESGYSNDIAFNLTIPLPTSVCSLETDNQSLKLSYCIKRDSNISTVNTVNIADTDYNFKQISISYKDLSNLGLYNWCEIEANNLVGPYDNFIVSITFKDPFGQQAENNSLNFSIDFREKPSSLNSVLLGRDGVYDERGTLDSALSIARQKSSSTIFFPSQKSDNIIIDGENMIICFDPTEAKSYMAQTFSKYYIDIYKNNKLLVTYSKNSNEFISGDEYKKEAEKVCLIINTKNLFNDLSEYYVKIRVEDSLIYNNNISEPSKASNILYGCIRAVPTLELSNLNYSPDEYDTNIIIINYNKNISINWPNKFFNYNPFLREIEYLNWSYPPPPVEGGEGGTFEEVKLCNFSLQIRFEDGDWVKYPLYTFYSLDYTTNTDLDTKITGNANRFYVRAKVEYYTGLGYNGESFYNMTNIVYSTPQLIIGKIPTISQRKNRVGINGAPNNNNVFSVTSLKDNYNIGFYGNDLIDPSILHNLKFDLSQGLIYGEKFAIDWSLIPSEWFITTNEIREIDLDSYNILYPSGEN